MAVPITRLVSGRHGKNRKQKPAALLRKATEG